jgi:hypothetical protein
MLVEHIFRGKPPQSDQARDEGMMWDNFVMLDKLMSKNRSSPEAELLPSRFDGNGARRGSGPDKGVKGWTRSHYPINLTMGKWSN